MRMLMRLGLSLALTLGIELGFALSKGLRNKKDLLLVGLVNLLTNPVVVLAYSLCRAATNWPRLAIELPLELMAFLVEALLYRAYAPRIIHPFRFSLCANGLSYGVGLLFNLFLGGIFA